MRHYEAKVAHGGYTCECNGQVVFQFHKDTVWGEAKKVADQLNFAYEAGRLDGMKQATGATR